MVLVAVDVGTTSARAGVLDRTGCLLARATHPIQIARHGADRAEYQSEDIWNAVCKAVRAAVDRAAVRPEDVLGLSFSATCSLVVRDRNGAPLPVGPGQDGAWDTIVWLDHRAANEARTITQTGHKVLDFAGGVMSPEMEIPKLMWLKSHLPRTWEQIGALYDLADFLTFKSSGSMARSQSTLTAKWTYLAHDDQGWQHDFLVLCGLEDVLEKGQLPDSATPVGTDLGPLTGAAAQELGLTENCRVGTGMIDGHAGAMGALAAFSGTEERLERHLGLIAGTSSAITALNRSPRPAPGLWGPYFGALLPDCWLIEGGQSASGAALDHLIATHGAGSVPSPEMHEKIVARIDTLHEQGELAPRLHVLPDFHGNRSPFANPDALGVISGLSLDASFDGLCALYWRTCVAIACGIRQILETLNAQGYEIDTLHIAGGHTRNPLLMALYADMTGCVVNELPGADAMLLGTAISAASAAGLYPDLKSAAMAMAQEAIRREPDPLRKTRYDADYAIFKKMHAHRAEIDAMSVR